jgi:hypothetical protein
MFVASDGAHRAPTFERKASFLRIDTQPRGPPDKTARRLLDVEGRVQGAPSAAIVRCNQ